jgi:hypothetical protein
MNDTLLLFRGDRSRGHLAAFLAVAAVLQAALQYLWLFAAQPLNFRVWGWTLLPAWLAPLAALPFLYRVSTPDLRAIRAPFGGIGRWAAGLLLPLALFGALVWWYQAQGGKLDPDWKWTTLGLSAVADLPLLALWLLPMTVVQDLAWRMPFAGPPFALARPLRALLSGAVWTASNAVLLVFIGTVNGSPVALAAALYLFGAGAFLFRLQERGAHLVTAVTCGILAIAPLLLFGSTVASANHLLFGYDVEKVTALLVSPLLSPELVLLITGAALALAAMVGKK